MLFMGWLKLDLSDLINSNVNLVMYLHVIEGIRFGTLKVRRLNWAVIEVGSLTLKLRLRAGVQLLLYSCSNTPKTFLVLQKLEYPPADS